MKTINRRLLTVVAACLAVPAFAQTSAREYSLDIERQPLAAALTEFSKQTGLQVGYFPETLTESILIGPLSGSYTVEAAITQLLLPSGLSFERLNERTIAVTGPESTRAQRYGFSTIERKTGDRTAPSFVRLANLRLAEGPATEEDDQQIRTAANAREPDDSKRKRLAGALEEVIVTAQKRVENLQEVPISISVLGEKDLDRSTLQGLAETLRTVPGVTTNVSALGGGTQVAVRGVAAANDTFAGSSPVAYYLDSIPFGLATSSVVPDANVYDLERVEILRGPQGTLYGAGSLNGVVRVLTKDADLDEFQLKARTSGSSTERGGESYRGDMAVNVPVFPGQLAARAVLGYQALGGWIDRLSRKDGNDAEILNARLKLNAQPVENLSVGLTAWLSRADYDALSISPDNRQIGSLVEEPFTTDYDVYGLTIGYDFSAFSATSTTSYLDYLNGGILDSRQFGAGGRFLQTLFEANILSQEISLRSTHGGAWRWSLGGIYRDAEDRLFQNIPGVIPAPVDNTRMSESFAVFGELTRIFLEGELELTGGLRYFEDRLTTREDSNFTGGPPGGVFARAKFDAVSPRVVLTWYPNQQTTLYASYSEGFRSGGSNNHNAVLAGFPSTQPDELTNYEIGAKGILWGGRLNFDAATYYIDWQDVQQQLLVFFGNVPLSALVNSESASGLGFDFGATAEIADGLTLGASFSWNDLAFDTAVLSRGVSLFREGDRLNFSAERTVGAFAEYVFALGDGGYQGLFAASGNYVAEWHSRRLQGTNVVASPGGPMRMGRISFAINSPKNWTATLFVDNVSNEENALIHDRAGNDDHDMRVRPRTIGVQLEYRL